MQFCILFLLVFILPISMFASSSPSSENPQVVILLGPPASGKGTQAIRVAEKLHLPHISTGDLFRENISKNTPLGQQAKSYMDNGQLVPDDLVLQLLFDRTDKSDAAKGYILDGFPRTIYQAEALEKHLPKNASLIVLNLNVSDATILQRALGRKRSDDTPEVVKERLNAYHTQTAPLINYYKNKNLLVDINGEKTPDEVFKELMDAFQ